MDNSREVRLFSEPTVKFQASYRFPRRIPARWSAAKMCA
jgi:hypothetical protein